MSHCVEPGRGAPLGATPQRGGVNFSVYSRDATLVELLLFDRVDDPRPREVIALDPARHRTYHYWHFFVPHLKSGQLYAYRAHGPNDPGRGLRFDPQKALLDPYGRAVVTPAGYSRLAACQPGDNAATAMKSAVVDLSAYDWEGDAPLRRPFATTVIYEMHVAGFTRHPNSGVATERRGTYAGLIEKIPYLKDLGITAVELLPVFQFDLHDCPPGLVNHWGYSPISFFAPHAPHSSRRGAVGPVDEFRDMVKALHRAGIEVILDVVYNHTAEGNHEGPTLCFKGLQSDQYYILEPDRSRFANYTGTGNTLNANQPIVRRLILDSLHFWVEQMHVDGFRFDLASILSRDMTGRPLQSPPVLWDIESSPPLAGTKLIAEAWDAAGLYQVGSFVGDSWREWNGKFRDDIRRFVKGDRGSINALPARLLASPDLYGHEERDPEPSINFVTCHDGFTLNDLVSFNGKHNEANGEENRDGADDNHSWNCGAEGPTDDPEVEALRNRQAKNMLTLLLFSLGTPMLVMGDEVRRTQRGNNNAHCQDSEMSWFDWSLLERHGDIHRFAKTLIARRLESGASRTDPRASLNELMRRARLRWSGVRLDAPDWGSDSHTLALTSEMPGRGLRFHWIFNAHWEAHDFELPPGESPWRRWIDTSLPPPEDICEWSAAPEVRGATQRAGPRSIVALVGRAEGAVLPARGE